MLPLPILNVRLNACHEDWQQMTPTEQGHHCATCRRTVLDFTTATLPDLEAAFRTSPDGRVCGRFRAEQLAPPPRLRPRLRQFLVALVLVCGLGLTSQEAMAQVRKETTKQQQTADTWLGMVVEQMPVYRNGGQEGLIKYIKLNAHYPQGAKKSGRVFVGFTVTATGKVIGIEIKKGLEPLLDKEAVRVVSQMGPWIPGQQQNRPVPVQYILPITFKVQ